jgi:hypothetical protein
VNQDAADIHHRAQIEQIDQQQFAAHAQTAQQSKKRIVFHRSRQNDTLFYATFCTENRRAQY